MFKVQSNTVTIHINIVLVFFHVWSDMGYLWDSGLITLKILYYRQFIK